VWRIGPVVCGGVLALVVILGSACDDESSTAGERTFSPAALTAAARQVTPFPSRDATADQRIADEIRSRLEQTLTGAEQGVITEVRVTNRRKLDINTSLPFGSTESGSRICQAALAANDEVFSTIIWNVDGGALARCQRAQEGD